MELLAQFLAICIIGILLYLAYFIYTKVESHIKKHKKLFIIILLVCYSSIGISTYIFDNLKIENIFLTILFSLIGIFSFFLTWCIIFASKKPKN